MRGRGLKLSTCSAFQIQTQSPPMRGRGLKLFLFIKPLKLHTVAPHAGAWIETAHNKRAAFQNYVAPHAGAWIETKALPDLRGIIAFFM